MNARYPLPPLEMWGGVECTINRVGDIYFDQLERNGHASRLDDLARFAELGIRKLRYPIQWERIAPHGLAHADWSWADERLELLRTLGITPIVGLTHHGSGPRSTSLIEPSFAEGLAQFAGAVAERYPWIEYYTPVNEPLTTARFSGLYGHWYPHGRDRRIFARALLTQCRAVALSMQAIRCINPQAKLIQTEDLGKAFSTPLLASQAEMENERRWLTFDLLCGCLNSTKPMWHFLLSSGCDEAELTEFLEHPCIPDVLGIDYYLTSERFLDEDIDRYPSDYYVHNGQHAYADVEVVRVDTGTAQPVGHEERMREAWERYKLPIAITEAHLGSTREEQVRWLAETWNAAQALRQEGAQVRAITAWSLLGAYDWNNLVTRVSNFYEPGVFDVRGTHPRPTALARLVRTLASGQDPDEIVLAQQGWWRHPDRFLYHSSLKRTSISSKEESPPVQGRPIMIIGETGGLENAFARACEVRHLPYQYVTHTELGSLDEHALHALLHNLRPWAVIATTGCGYGEDGRSEPEREPRSRHLSFSGILADLCAEHEIALLMFSSALVFSATQQKECVESTPVAPCCPLGEQQAVVEKQVLQRCPSALIIRTGSLLYPWESREAVERILHGASHPSHAGGTFAPVSALTYVPDLVPVCLDLLIDGERGLWHLANTSTQTKREGMQANASQSISTGKDILQNDADMLFTYIMPSFTSERGQLLPSLEDALMRYQRECPWTEKVSRVS